MANIVMKQLKNTIAMKIIMEHWANNWNANTLVCFKRLKGKELELLDNSGCQSYSIETDPSAGSLTTG